MQPQSTGIVFHETMSGGLMLGEHDYHSGERKARVAGDILAMHADVVIPDLERFIHDPRHAGELAGTIDYPPFGNDIACRQGRFNLFSPGSEPDTKLMIYELGFELQGEPCYLSGKKVVRDDPGFDMWGDTTTLYTTLHSGTDNSGEVLGAGILNLGMSELVSLLASMEVIGEVPSREKVRALGRFGRFFLGELWDSYVGLGTDS